MDKKSSILIIVAIVAAVLLYATYMFIEGRLDASETKEKQSSVKPV